MPPAQSVILTCAGIGSRLGLAQTKALVRIMGKSIIAWQMEAFAAVDDLRVVVGYQAMEVVREVRKYRNDAIFVYNHNYFRTRTGRSFMLGARHGNELLVEWDGDLLVHPDDARRLLALREEYIAYTEATTDEPVFVTLDDTGAVTGFSREHPSYRAHEPGGTPGQRNHPSGEGRPVYEWAGPCCVRKSRLTECRDDVFQMLEPHLPLPGIPIRAQDIDTYNDYKRAEEFIRSW